MPKTLLPIIILLILNCCVFQTYGRVLTGTNRIIKTQNGISNYSVSIGVGVYLEKVILVIRKFEQFGQSFYIAVDLEDLETQIIPSDKIVVRSSDWLQVLNDYQKGKDPIILITEFRYYPRFPKREGDNFNY